MRLAISDIAWDQKDNNKIYSLMQQNGFKGLEIAPTKIWDDIDLVTNNEIDIFLRNLERYDVHTIAMQSVLYGKQELIIWGSKKVREATLKYLSKIIEIAGNLDVKAIVFGSPKNRIMPENQDRNELEKIGNDFFYTLAEKAIRHNTKICLEPNPVEYGTNFINTTKEAIDFVKNLNHSALNVNLDTGTIILNKEKDYEYLAKNSKYIGHVHISEPFLETVKIHNQAHQYVRDLVEKIEYTGWVSIEMKQQDTDNVLRVSNVLANVRNLYC